MNYTEELSQFIVDLRFEDLSTPVVDLAKKSLLDWIGVATGAARAPAVEILIDVLDVGGTEKQSSILGRNVKTTAMYAALVNGTMSHVLDYDDAHSVVRTHPSAPLVPALLAVAEHLALPGRQLITALVAGLEATIRIGFALGRRYYEKGWHATSVLGRIGTAAGVAGLLDLTVEQTSLALGIAATQAGGVRDVFGTMCKSFHAGKASMDGLLSVLLARKNFSGPLNLLNPDAGFARVFSDEYDPSFIVDGLGIEYRALENSFKPYAACLLTHPVVDGLINLKMEYGLEAGLIDGIEVFVNPFNVRVAGNPEPRDGTEAKFSIQAAAALASIYGKATNSVFTNERINDPAVRALMAKVKPVVKCDLAETEAILVVRLTNGKEHNIHVTVPKGSPGNPLTFDNIADKTRDLVLGILSRQSVDEIIGLTKHLEDLPDVAKLMDMCRTE